VDELLQTNFEVSVAAVAGSNQQCRGVVLLARGGANFAKPVITFIGLLKSK
jgi:hypothetical protein